MSEHRLMYIGAIVEIRGEEHVVDRVATESFRADGFWFWTSSGLQVGAGLPTWETRRATRQLTPGQRRARQDKQALAEAWERLLAQRGET